MMGVINTVVSISETNMKLELVGFIGWLEDESS
jgi:hypothetical protein